MQQNHTSILLRSVSVALLAAGSGITPQVHAACASQNTCFGINALQSVTTGDLNTAFGYEALFSDSTGSFNSAFGASALRSNTTGTSNTAFGSGALRANTTGERNTAVGNSTLISFATGTKNTAVGNFALAGLEAPANGDRNTALGDAALYSLTSGSDNTALGNEALEGTTASPLFSAVGNTAVGSRAMERVTSAEGSTAIGYLALLGINGDSPAPINFNTAVGAGAMQLNRDGVYNTATGYHALFSQRPGITGDRNTANGANALLANTKGSGNTASGADSLHSNTEGFRNTGAGINSLGSVTTGGRNTAFGAAAGSGITTGSDNIVIGAQNPGQAAENGVIRIGNGAFQKKAFIAGVSGVTTGLNGATAVFVDANGQLGTIKSSQAFKEDIQPLADASERIYELRPVSFRYKQPYEDGSKPVQYGLIAEEVARVFPELVVYDAQGKPETVAYHLLASLLLNELQKERSVTDRQTATLERQALELAQLKEDMSRMTALIAQIAQGRQ